MRIITSIMFIFMMILSLISTSYAYTLTLDVSEDRIDIQRPVQNDPVVYATQDVTISITTEGLGRTDPWHLDILALDDLLGPESIPASTISWEVLEGSFVDGQLVKGTPQLMVSGVGNQTVTGQVRFKYTTANYMPGSFTMTVRYILSTP